MAILFDCPGCGRRLKVSDLYRGMRSRCPECAAISVVPGHDEQPVRHDVAVQEAPPEGGVARVRLVPGEAEGVSVADVGPTCPSCRKILPRGAVLCVDCGYDFRTGRQRETAHEPLERSWDTGMPLALRLGLLCALECVCLPAGALTGHVAEGLALAFAGSVVLVLLLGTYIKLRLVRTGKGKILITRTWCICFLPAIRHQVNVRNYKVILIDTTRPNVAGILATMLLLLLCVLPGAVLAYVILTRPTYHVFLKKEHRNQEFLLYQSMDDAKMRELVETLQELAELRVDRR